MMRIFCTITFILLLLTGLQAQIELKPLRSNEVIKRHLRTTGQLELVQQQSTALRSKAIDCDNPEDNLYSNGDFAYVESGLTITICVDTILFPIVSCLNCTADLGQDTIIQNGNCFDFVSRIDIEANTQGLSIQQCNEEGECDVVEVFVTVKRPRTTTFEALTTVGEDTTIILCVSNMTLPGQIETSQFLDCGTDLPGNITNGILNNDCFKYESNRLGGNSTICLEICDNNCICDVFNFPIRIIADTITSLPFFDDFAYEGPYPDRSLWIDEDVFVNTTQAILPPSVGVATFDGIDRTGEPYGDGFGKADYLTSRPIDLSQQDSFFLSFYLQPGGLGYVPGNRDSLALQFRDSENRWRSQAIYTVGNFSTDTFTFQQIAVKRDTNYLHDGFQFRFVNHNNRNGILSIWHLDYILLDNERRTIDFDDVANVRKISGILKNYTAIPWEQLDGNEVDELANSYDLIINNQTPSTVPLNANFLTIKELNSNQTFIDQLVFLDDTEANPGTDYTIINEDLEQTNFDLMSNGVISLRDNGPFLFESTFYYELNQRNDINVLSNDTVSLLTVCNDYYAYDDGTAEKAVGAQSPEQQIVVRFNVNNPQELTAVQFHFPHYRTSDLEEFRIKIHRTLEPNDGGLLYESDFLKPVFLNQIVDSLQGFTTFVLEDEEGNPTPLSVDPGNIYVGWEQTSSATNDVDVGIDLNTIASNGSEEIHWFFLPFSQPGGEWRPFALPGSIMVRPIFGGMPINSTSTEETSKFINTFSFYPNPVNDVLNVNITDDNYDHYTVEWIDITGRVIERETLRPEKLLNNFEKGVYFVRIFDRNGELVHVQKIIKI